MTFDSDINAITAHSKVILGCYYIRDRKTVSYEEFRDCIKHDCSIDIDSVASGSEHGSGIQLLQSLKFQFGENNDMIVPAPPSTIVEILNFAQSALKKIPHFVDFSQPCFDEPLPIDVPQIPDGEAHDASHSGYEAESFGKESYRRNPAELVDDEFVEYYGDPSILKPGMTVKFGGSMERYIPKLPDLPMNSPENYKCMMKAQSKFRKQIRDIHMKHEAYLVRVATMKTNVGLHY